MPHSRYIVWIDCEMTGLDLHHDELIEIAVVVTDGDLNPLDDGLDVVIRPSEAALAQMNDFVRDMHTTSGLIDELPAGLSLHEAGEQVMAYVRSHVCTEGTAPLAGNSIGTDRAFLARDLPELNDYLSYRCLDVSSVKELARRWFPRVYFQNPAKNGGHRAMADIIESIRELDYYRRVLFVAPPGPTSQDAQLAAAASVARFAPLLENR
ncbi:oligoribonuclease [Pseudoclavibacter soli]|uniref:oligoribonuclease n=1 Tax=Pseudoclavibacter soli TaxID=452623 RepID=UPI0003FB593C|nr:oligoribonuclease [Pseudoclavibacter soli]